MGALNTHADEARDWIADSLVGTRLLGVVRAWWLLGLFLVIDAQFVLKAVGEPDWIGADAAIYRHAAEAWLNGGNPWAEPYHRWLFAGPPPTLIPLLPFVPLGELVRPIWMLISLGASIFAIRRLDLPLWWLAWPPVLVGTMVGNPNNLVLALVLIPAGALAIPVKVYAALPMLWLGRWRELVGAGILILGTAPFLPWTMFIDSYGGFAQTLTNQSSNLSTWGTLFVVPTLVVLLWLKRETGAWLSIPALWPSTQPTYNAFALPLVARMPLVAAALAFDVRLMPLTAVVFAVWYERDRIVRRH